MTWRTPVIVAATAFSVVFFSRAAGKVLGDSTTLLSPIEGIASLPSITTTPTPTPTETPTPTPTKKITPPPAGGPTPTPSAGWRTQPQFSSAEIYAFTEKYGILYAVDPNVIRHVTLCESGFNPSAKNYIYAGLFQFDTNTWIIYRQKMGLSADPDLRYHAEEAIRTGTYILSLGKTGLWPNCYPK